LLPAPSITVRYLTLNAIAVHWDESHKSNEGLFFIYISLVPL
jgi:hypothetical protein